MHVYHTQVILKAAHTFTKMHPCGALFHSFLCPLPLTFSQTLYTQFLEEHPSLLERPWTLLLKGHDNFWGQFYVELLVIDTINILLCWTLSHTLSHTLTHSHTLSHTHTHTHSHTLSHTHTLTHSHTLTWDFLLSTRHFQFNLMVFSSGLEIEFYAILTEKKLARPSRRQ